MHSLVSVTGSKSKNDEVRLSLPLLNARISGLGQKEMKTERKNNIREIFLGSKDYKDEKKQII